MVRCLVQQGPWPSTTTKYQHLQHQHQHQYSLAAAVRHGPQPRATTRQQHVQCRAMSLQPMRSLLLLPVQHQKQQHLLHHQQQQQHPRQHPQRWQRLIACRQQNLGPAARGPTAEEEPGYEAMGERA
jgi:hypothetical protein